jgi:hypothetical protein
MSERRKPGPEHGERPEARFIQIATQGGPVEARFADLFALDEDGNVWSYNNDMLEWEPVSMTRWRP